MLYAVFHNNNRLDGKLAPLMGSDSYLPIDGRYSVARAKALAEKQIHRLRNVQPDIVGYEIRRGTISNSARVAGLFPAPGRNQEFNAAKEKGIIEW
jgi:hypothetical protein